MLFLACGRVALFEGAPGHGRGRRDSDGPFVFWGRYLLIPYAITINAKFVATKFSLADGSDLATYANLHFTLPLLILASCDTPLGHDTREETAEL